MKYRVIGWTFYDNYEIEEGDITFATEAAVIDEIRSKGYNFTGYDHQERWYCAPILNDGKILRFSQRGFGDIMAQAHGVLGPLAYTLYDLHDNSQNNSYYPDEYIPSNDEIETDLSETFEVEVDEETFVCVQEGKTVKLDDINCYRYIDRGDIFLAKRGDKTVSREIYSIDRRKDLTKEERIELMDRQYDFKHPEIQKAANEEFYRIPIKIFVEFKPEIPDTKLLYELRERNKK